METQEALPLFESIHRPYRLYAPVTATGFFALSSLRNFCEAQIEPLLSISDALEVELDFSAVKLWDIGAVLWLTMALQHYRKKELSFKIRLPDGREGDPEAEIFRRSADFLRRWKFDRALKHVDDLEHLLVPEQRDFFAKGPVEYYKEGSAVRTPSGLTETLLSNRLLEIRDLAESDSPVGFRKISNSKIEACIREFSDAKIGNILASNCQISPEDAECFAEHLVAESLLNMQQHPNATSGLLAVAVNGNSRELILTVADNGEPIQSTILSVYNAAHGTSYSLSSFRELPAATRINILHYATQPNVSSKPMRTDESVGLGLTYIKFDTVRKFNGRVRFIAGSAEVTYSTVNSPQHGEDDEIPFSAEEWKHSWKGNLIRISIPLKVGRL